MPKKVQEKRHLRNGSLYYHVARFAACIVSKVALHCKILQNDLNGTDAPYLVLANHESELDAINLLRACKKPVSIVISHAYYNTLPLQRIMDSMGVIPKQQFQTRISDMNKMKNIIDEGKSLAIYPAGLMSEDGYTTPIPDGTAKFIRWLGVDVYVARTAGTYMVKPKWSKKRRPGTTTLTVKQLFKKEDLKTLSLEEIDKNMRDALCFDAYREQENLRYTYKGGKCVEGLENVLYRCPKCGKKYSIEVSGEERLVCSSCGYSVYSDDMGVNGII